jgi:hypothetical protein
MQNNTDTAHTCDPYLYGITLLSNTQANTFGQIPYYMFPSGQTTTGSTTTTIDGVRDREVEGWQESDYLDYEDFENAIENDEAVSFALCQWLMRQSHGNIGDGFTDEEWDEWYFYALEHCPRFAAEQPRRR